MGSVMTDKQTPRPGLLSLATSVPPYRLKQSDVANFCADLFQESFADFERLMPIYGNAAIDSRYSCVPLDWYAEPHGFKECNALYVENALNLLEDAAGRALAQAGLGHEDVDAVISVSSSGIATPSLDALIVERMNLRRDVERLPVFGLGCAGGVIGLARAGAESASTKTVDVVVRGTHGHHLDGTAGEAKGHGPDTVQPGPVEEPIHPRGQNILFKGFVEDSHGRVLAPP